MATDTGRGFGILLATALAGLAASGCSASSTAPSSQGPQVFVGTVTGTDASVALVLGGGDALFFACGGPTTLTTLTHWFRGSASIGAPFDYTEATSSATATGSATGGMASGTLTPSTGATPVAWSATLAPAGTLTGLYTDDVSGQGVGDLIVQQPTPSDTPAAVGAFRTVSNTVFQVTPFHPIALTATGILATVTLNGQSQQLSLTAASPSGD
jgi:hypothetical protein